MEDAFGYVIFGVVGVGIVIAILLFVTSAGAYEQIGKGGLFEERTDGSPLVTESAPVSPAVRDAEIRQMLEARNARRVKRGEQALDVEAELAALTREPTVDKALLGEIRDLVEARNARRVRRGEEPLDVEAEVQRQLRDLQG